MQPTTLRRRRGRFFRKPKNFFWPFFWPGTALEEASDGSWAQRLNGSTAPELYQSGLTQSGCGASRFNGLSRRCLLHRQCDGARLPHTNRSSGWVDRGFR